MTTSELRMQARKALTGKWGKAALLTLVYGIITFIISFLLNLVPAVGGIASTVISLPLSFGFLVSMIKLKRDEEIGYTDFLTIGFNKFGKIWSVLGHQIIKLIIPIVLVVVFIILMIFGGAGSAVGYRYSSNTATAGFGALAIIGIIGYIVSLIYLIVKGFLYALSYYILYDNEDMPAKEIVEKSESLMNGHRWKYFWLPITFIGWLILAGFTFGIGMLWLTPYMMVTLVCFYEELAGTKGTVESTTVESVVEPVAEAKEETDPIKNEDE